MADAINIHATVLVVGDRGILIRGPSGSGKTTLALALAASAAAAGRFAALVGDDQLMAHPVAGRLVCRAPESIAGLVEVRGRTPLPVAHVSACVVDLAVSLVPPHEAPRYAEPEAATLAGCTVPVMRLSALNVESTLPALASWLLLPPFCR